MELILSILAVIITLLTVFEKIVKLLVKVKIYIKRKKDGSPDQE